MGGGRGRGGDGGELASVSVLWWRRRRWWWEVVEVVGGVVWRGAVWCGVHTQTFQCWLAGPVLSQGPAVTTSQGCGLAAYSVPETAETEQGHGLVTTSVTSQPSQPDARSR